MFGSVIEFLEDDPYVFSSGYNKEKIWKYIRRYELSSNDIARLENAALQYLFRPMSREFRYMCQTMCRIASDKFWENVKLHLDSDDEIVKLNASCLFAYSDGMKAGETQRLAWKNRRWKYVPKPENYTIPNLITLIQEPENWHNEQIVYRKIPDQDLPILYYMSRLDTVIASLDISQSNKDIVLEKFENVLSIGELNVHITSTWVYVIYLLRYINDERAVPIVIRFLQSRIDYKFESMRKNIMQRGCFKVLKYYNTPEARIVLEAYKEKDQEFADNSRNDMNGWLARYPD